MTVKRSIADALEAMIAGSANNAVPAASIEKRKGEVRAISAYAHLCMARSEISGEVAIGHRRVIAGMAAGYGSIGQQSLEDVERQTTYRVDGADPIEDLERNVRRTILTAEKYLNTAIHGWRFMTFSGIGSFDAPADGRTWVAIENVHNGEPSFIDVQSENQMVILGFGWLCKWGDKYPRYGRVMGIPLPNLETTFLTVVPMGGQK